MVTRIEGTRRGESALKAFRYINMDFEQSCPMSWKLSGKDEFEFSRNRFGIVRHNQYTSEVAHVV